MNYKKLFWLMIGLITIVGCGVNSELPPSAEAAKTATSFPSAAMRAIIQTPTPGRVVAATITLTATKTVMPTETLSSRPVSLLHKQCLQVLPSIPEKNTLEGKIVLYGKRIKPPGKDGYKEAYYEVNFYDLKTGQSNLLSRYQPRQIVVSSDRKKYAIVDAPDDLVKIFSADGRLLKIISKGTYPWFIGGWLDDQHLELVVAQGFPTLNVNFIKYPRDVVIVNLGTGQQQYFSSDYPKIEKANIFSWDGSGTTYYDPTLTRVIYPSVIESDYKGYGGQGYTLWDVIHKQKITEVVNNGERISPKWSPDASKIVFSGLNRDLFTLTRDGNIQQLTYFNPEMLNETLSEWYNPVEYSWSPDGQRLAFWLVLKNSNGSSHASLAILDMRSGEITDYCESSGYTNNEDADFPLDSPFIPVWSPDGNYLAVIKVNGQQDGSVDTLLIDLNGSSLVKIGENLAPIGWLKTNN